MTTKSSHSIALLIAAGILVASATRLQSQDRANAGNSGFVPPPPNETAQKATSPAGNGKIFFPAADLSLSVAFEWEAPHASSPALEQIIIKDCARIYGHLPKVNRREFEPLRFRIGNRDISTSTKIHISGEGLYRPEYYREHFGWVSLIDGKETLLVPKEITGAYLKVSALRNAHPEAAAKLLQFAEQLEKGGADRFAGMEPTDVIWTPETQKHEPAMWQHMLRELKKAPLRAPNFADLFVNEAGETARLLPKVPVNALIAKAMTLDAKSIPSGYWPIIFHDGKWKFIVVE